MPKARKKHVSMKKKASWRKHTDMTDVDQFLDEQRLQERIGGDLSIKPDDELFQDDKKPTKVTSVREERKLRAQKPSKCYVSLENTSKVEDPISKRNHVRTPYERKHPLTKAKIQRNKELGIIPERELQSLTDRIAAGNKIPKTRSKEVNFARDIWAEDEHSKIPELESMWVNPLLKQYHMKNLGVDVVKVPQITHEKRSKLKAVEKPIGGSSYNPDEKELDSLITSAVVKEEAIIKREERFNRALKPLFEKITKGEAKRRRREEMTQGFPINSEDEVDNDLSETEYKALNPPVRNKKKDLKQRRKQKEGKLRKARFNLEKQELKKLKDLKSINMFKSQIKKQENVVVEKQITRIEKRIKAKSEPGRIARKKFEGEEIPVPSSIENLGSLRKVAPEGSMLVDRFMSLQKRNILAPNLKRLPRRRRLTTVKKHQFKEEAVQPLTKKQKKQNAIKIVT